MEPTAAQAGTTPSGPSPLSKEMRILVDQRVADNEAKEAARQAELKADGIKRAADHLWAHRGTRFQNCRLTTFELHGTPQEREEQTKMIRTLDQYAARLAAHIDDGAGLLLTGKPGTGKDHLVAALMHHAIEAGKHVAWISGLDLFAQMRADIGSGYPEAGRRKEYTEPAVWVVSDPAWEAIPLTDQQRRYLGAIVDARWNNRRPIWMTINATGTPDAKRLLGGALVDRLRDGALSLACNWSSYRKTLSI